MFQKTKEIDGKNIAMLESNDKYVTYDQLWKESRELEIKIGTRNLIFILCNYSIETVAFYYLVMGSRNVPLLLDENIHPNSLNKLVQIYEPKYIWNQGEYLSNLCLPDPQILWSEDSIYFTMTGYEKQSINVSLALLLTTSGSTGNSKLVRLSYENLEHNVTTSVKELEVRQSDKGITTMPMNYTYGLSVLHMHWKIGATIVVTKHGMLKKEFWDLFEKERVTNFAGVPFHYEIMQKTGFLNQNMSHLRFITEGGGKLSTETQMQFANLFEQNDVKFYVLYGQTEGTTILSKLPPEDMSDKLGSIGVPIIGMSAELSGNENEGELIFKGKSVSLGYAESYKDLDLGDTNKGVLCTGDLATIDKDGFIYIKGRIKRFTKIMGIRINLDDIEMLVRKKVGERGVACLGNDDNILIFYEGSKFDEISLVQFISNCIHINRRFIKIINKIELPRLSSGKVDYMGLQKG